MGKATIVSGGTSGLYQVALDYGKDTQTARLTAIEARLTELVGLLSTALQDLNLQEYAQAALVTKVEEAIADFVAAAQALYEAQQAVAVAGESDQVAANAALKAAEDAYQTTLKAHTEAMKKLAESARKTAPLKLAFDLLKAEKTQLIKDQAKWAELAMEANLPAWCADLTEDATGDVATIEIPGEDKLILIAPSAPAHVPAADGVLTAREVQTPEQVFFNAAILPGWQKFKPTYRRGTITALSEESDTASVTLTDDKSSAQGLGINQVSTLAGVPVVYMTCNASAFAVGDECLVRFDGMSWDNPKVVGFVSNPKPCGPEFVLIPIQQSTTDWEGSGSYTAFGATGVGAAGNVCGYAGVLFHSYVITAVEKFFWRRIKAAGSAYFPDGNEGWSAAAFSDATLWEARHGVYQDSNVPTSERPAHRTYNQSYVVSASWAGLQITTRNYPFTAELSLPSGHTPPNAEPACLLNGYVSAVAHAGVTETGDGEGGMPVAGPITTLVDTDDFTVMAAFLGVSGKVPATLTLTKGARSVDYKYDGLTGSGSYGSSLWIKYKRPGPA